MTPPNARDGRHRDTKIDTLRLLLALTVVVSSSFLVADGWTDRDPFKQFVHGQLISSHMAIDCFFMLSGYLATMSVERCRTAWEYLSNRVRRVYPGLAWAVLFYAAIVPLAGGSFTHAGPARVTDWLWHLTSLNQFGYQGIFPANPFPGQLFEFIWAIPYGFGCYLLTLLLHRTGLLKRVWPVAAIWIVTAIAGAWASGMEWYSNTGRWHAVAGYPHLWMRALPYFFGGSFVYLMQARIHWNWRWLAVALAVLVAGAQFRPGWEAAFPFAGLYTLFYIALKQRLQLPDLARWGDFSYGVFLWHFPILQLLVMHGFGVHAPYRLLAAALPLSLLAGAVSWWGVERWFLAYRTRKPLASSQPKLHGSPAVYGSSAHQLGHSSGW